MKILGRDDLLKGSNLKRELVEVPELNGSLYIRELSTAQLLTFNARIEALKGEKTEVDFEASVNLMALIVSFSACDETGNLLFTEADAAKLAENRIKVLGLLSTKALHLSGMDINIAEATNNLKNAPQTSSSGNSVRNSRKRSRK